MESNLHHELVKKLHSEVVPLLITGQDVLHELNLQLLASALATCH